MNSNDNITITFHVNGKPVEQELKKLEQQATELRTKMDAAFTAGDTKQHKKLEQQLKQVEKQTERVAGQHRRLNQTLNNLSTAKPKELRAAMKRLNEELGNPAVKRGSKQWNDLQEQISRCRTELKLITEESKAANTSIEGRAITFGKDWVGVTTIAMQTLDIFGRIKNFAEEYVQEYAQMAEAEADVRKYTGMTRAEVEALNQAFREMDTRTSRQQLNALAADAGRLGITAQKDVMDFVQAADMINVALGEDLGEGAVKNIGKLAQLFGDADTMGLKASMIATGSTINALGQSSSASEAYIVDFTARLAGTARQAGITQAQVMALAAVLDQSMVASEEGSTALSRIIQELYRKPAAMAAAAGLNVKQFTQLIRTDANAALLQFLQAVSRMGGMEKIAPMLGELRLTGSGVSKTLAALAGNIDLVRSTQAQATQEFQQGTSILQEYQNANTTPQAELEKHHKKVQDLRIELGAQLMPVMSSAMQIFSTSAGFVMQNRKAIVALTASIALLTVASNLALIKQKALTVATTLFSGISTTATIITEALRVLYYRWTGQTIALATAQTALNAALTANPVGAVVTVVLTLVAALGAWWGIEKMLGNTLKDNTQQMEDNETAMQRATRRAAENTEAERVRVQRLVDIINSNAHSYDTKRRAMLALQKIVPGFHADLKEGARLTNEQTAAIGNYIRQLDKKATAEAYYEELVDINKRIQAAERKARQKQFNIDSVNAEIYRNPDKYVRTPVRNYTGTGHSFSYEVSSPALAAKEAERAVHERDLKNTNTLIARLKAERNLITQAINTDKEVQGYFDSLIITPTTPLGNDGGGGSGEGENESKAERKRKEKLQKDEEALKKRFNAERAAAQLRRETGITDRREMEIELLDIENRYLLARRDLYEKGSAEWTAIEEQRLRQQRSDIEKMTAWSIEEADAKAETERAAAIAAYVDGKTDYKTYQDELRRISQNTLRAKAQAARAWGNDEEAARLELQLEQDILNEKLEKRRTFEQQAAEMQQQYLKQSIAERREAEIKLLDELIAMGLIKAEDREKMVKSITQKYDNEEAGEGKKDKDNDKAENLGNTNEAGQSIIALGKALDNLHNKLKDGSARWEDYAAVAVAGIGIVSATLNAASQLMQANQQAEEAAINARYDKEIEAAGTGTKRAKQLEEQKEKELAKTKKKYNARSMKIEMAQAVAQTATAAIAAYASAAAIPITGWIMAPIAAAMALAAGAVQIATIKKQHAAQDAGYYEGGFTGGNRWKEEAGIVHQGEFVANHQAVRNPALRPLLNLIDHAQRNNTVARLTTADISRTLTPRSTTPTTATTPPATPITLTESPRTAETLDRLTTAIEQGINATVVLDGPDGLERQWQHYQRLKGRK